MPAVDKIFDIPVLAFVGKQNSGKTTLVVQVVAELVARGVRVGTVKHHGHSGFEIDVEGKDSWRHREAGSAHTVISAPGQIATVRTTVQDPPLHTLIEQMLEVGADGSTPLDVVLVEGYRHGELPTIELFRAANPNDAERELGEEGNKIVAIVTDMPRIHATAAASNLPVFTFDSISTITDFILQQSTLL